MTEITISNYIPDTRCPTCFSDRQAVTISKEEYDELLRNKEELYALNGGGVTNWEWYRKSLLEAGFFDDENHN